MTDHIHVGHNGGIKYEDCKQFVDRIETLEAEKDVLAEAHKRELEPLNEDIAEIKAEALDAGFTKAAFNALLKRRKKQREIESIRDKLTNPSHQHQYDLMTLAVEPEAN